MKAAQIDTYGGPDAVQVRDIPIPDIKPGYVLVAVHASSLNPADTVLRDGGVKDMVKMDLPATLGGDFAGVVQEVGKGVQTVKQDDRVYGQAFCFYGDSGALAEYALVAQNHLAPMPKNVDFSQAASLVLAGVSAQQAIEEHAKLKPEQKILIHGGAGSVGSLAIQLAKQIGAFVATTVSSKDIVAMQALRADKIIDYRTQDFTALLQNFDVVIDLAGSPEAAIGDGLFEKSLRVLKPGGTLISLVAYFGQDAINRANQRGFNALYQLTTVNTASLNRLSQLVEQHIVQPNYAKTYPLSATREAFVDRENNSSGKIVITIR